MAYQRVAVLSGTERRRRYTPAEKVRMVAEAFRPGMVVTEAARRLSVHESLLYRWRRLMKAEAGVADRAGFVAVTITPEPVAAEPSEPVTPDPPVPSPVLPAPPGPAASPPGVLEIALPGGARVRLEGAVDPALAAAVLEALATPRRAP
jgi:transposase